MRAAKSLGFALLTVLLVVGLPLAGKCLRQGPDHRCELDGRQIEPRYRVRVVDGAGGSHSFCCVDCARRWLARQEGPPEAVYVTDETDGEEIDAGSAFFVRNSAIINPVTGSRTHAFRSREEAEAHAGTRGRLLTGADRPFPDEPGSARDLPDQVR